MCRFVLYMGKQPILIADLLLKPTHSIIKQSFSCKLRMDHNPLNGDGFGVGWYDTKVDPSPCVFTSVLPAWNNLNLKRISEKIQSKLVFAHVRAATLGLPISESNCHPWSYGPFMWMHNGTIAQFNKIKRRLQQSLRDSLFDMLQGTTDSENAFALFLNQFPDPLNGSYSVDEIKEAMLTTIRLINEWSEEAGIEEPATMNFAVADGRCVVASRYVNRPNAEPVSLYFSSGTNFECDDSGNYRMVKTDRREHVVIVASEPLTFEKQDWLPVPSNHLLVISPRLNVLLYPIPDRAPAKLHATIPANAPIVGVPTPNVQQGLAVTAACN